jgi:DNA replication protein DnaC
MLLDLTDRIRTYTVHCPECGIEHQAGMFSSSSASQPKAVLCDECADKARENEKERELLAVLKARWESDWYDPSGDLHKAVCPKRYRNFNSDLFKGNQAKINEALKWQFGSKGLVLHGHTGQGKTWAAFLIAKREHFKGRKVMVVNGNRLRELAAIAGESNVRYNQELSRIIRAELLVLNDPFKVKLTDKVEEALWEIVDERYEEERPIITTMNGVAKNIEPLLSPDRGKALFRRLREENHAIHFPNPETKR